MSLISFMCRMSSDLRTHSQISLQVRLSHFSLSHTQTLSDPHLVHAVKLHSVHNQGLVWHEHTSAQTHTAFVCGHCCMPLETMQICEKRAGANLSHPLLPFAVTGAIVKPIALPPPSLTTCSPLSVCVCLYVGAGMAVSLPQSVPQ